MEKQIRILVKNPNVFIDKATEKEIEELLTYLADLYYNTDSGSPISDELFDSLKDKLKELNPKNKFLKQIGAPIKDSNKRLPKVKLPYFMGSLDKIKPESDTLNPWKIKYTGPYVVSDKLDGVSGLIYKNDKGIIEMYTRGDGSEGQNITHLIPYVTSKKTVKFDKIPNGYAIRGELIITKNNFKKIEGEMANARNAVAGLVNSKVNSINLSVAAITNFVAYSILFPEMKQEEQMKELEKIGFQVVDYKIINKDKLTIEELGKLLLKRKEDSPYEMDGLVVIDSSKPYKVKDENPKYGFAYKQIAEIVDVIVKSVIWKASMDGYLKPRIEIAPVSISGVTITSATAFNAKYVVDNVIGKGAALKLIRSGDVIPYILEVIKGATSGKPDMPDVPYVWNETKVDIILNDIYSDAYNNVTIGKMAHFFKTLGIKYISEGILTKLVDSGYKTIYDILNADSKDLIAIEGIGQKLYDKIMDNTEASLLDTDLATFMAASRVFERGLGMRKLKLITDVYPDIMKNKWSKETFIKKIIEIEGFDTKTASLFVSNFESFKEFFEEINQLYDLDYMTIADKVDKVIGDKFKEQIVVFTGFRDEDLEQFIIDNGGKVSGTVSGKTTMLVYNGDTNSSKYKEAVKRKIQIYTKEEFIKKYPQA